MIERGRERASQDAHGRVLQWVYIASRVTRNEFPRDGSVCERISRSRKNRCNLARALATRRRFYRFYGSQ